MTGARSSHPEQLRAPAPEVGDGLFESRGVRVVRKPEQRDRIFKVVAARTTTSEHGSADCASLPRDSGGLTLGRSTFPSREFLLTALRVGELLLFCITLLRDPLLQLGCGREAELFDQVAAAGSGTLVLLAGHHLLELLLPQGDLRLAPVGGVFRGGSQDGVDRAAVAPVAEHGMRRREKAGHQDVTLLDVPAP
ncbi:hypothetical protein ACFWC9_29110 [Streptomyces goshikiensis]|uniref:hypothetical protein n=1 Tax=Streptomyces goshikiensis TaxID=1942 RepID=UPI0036B24FEF